MGKDERIVYRFSSMPPLIVISDEIIEERKEQIASLKRELINYRVVLKDLATIEVPYSIKNELLNIAFFIVQDVDILDKFKSKKNIPISVVAKEFGKTRRYLEEWRDNIITYVVILSDPKYKHIQDYLRVIEDEQKDIDVNALSILKNNKNIKGIVISSRKKVAMIMTSMGDVLKIKTNYIAVVGEEVEGIPKKVLRDYKFHLSMLAAIFLVLVGITILNYTKVVRTIMVGTTSDIILEANSFNRIKNIYSRTERGSKMVESIDVLDKSIDYAVYSIIKYANENDMMPQNGVVVAVNGKAIKYGTLSKTEDYIYVEQIDFKLNNSGIQQNFY